MTTLHLPFAPPSQVGVILLALSFLLTGCSINEMVSRRLADALVTQGQAPENDPVLAREASAFYLKLSESVLRQNPGNTALAETVAAGFTQYAFAFVSQQADFVEEKDPRQAEALRLRAARLYRRALQHALGTLKHQNPALVKPLLVARDDPNNPLLSTQVGLAYWAAAAWGGLISLSKDDPETLADLPQAQRLAQLAWNCDPGYGQGALASLMGTFEASRPGGDTALAQRYFDQAITLSAGLNAGIYLAKAELIALPAHDRPSFERLVAQALAVKTPSDHPQALANQIMQKRALWLSQKTDELF